MKSIFVLLLSLLGSCKLAASREQWVEVRSPNFLVVTNAGEKRGRQVAQEFESIRAVFQEYFGLKNTSAATLPVTIMAAKDESTLKSLVPEFWAKRGNAHPAGLALNRVDTNYILLRLDVSLNAEASSPYEPIYHEYLHYVLRGQQSHMPLWMVEGLAELFGNTKIEGQKVYLGAFSRSNLYVLRTTSLLPLSTLFDIDSSSSYYHEESKVSIFYAESWALTHYLMSRDWQEHTHKLQDFLDSLKRGSSQREAASKTIGDVDTLQKALGTYVHQASFASAILNAPDVRDRDFVVQPLSDAMALTFRGDVMAHHSNFAQARSLLEEALLLEPKLAFASESMAGLSLYEGKKDDAKTWAAQALTLDPKSFRANYYHALALHSGSMSETDVTQALQNLKIVVQIHPSFAPAYAQLAFVLSQPGPTQDLKEAYLSALRGVEYEPDDIQYRLVIVDVLEKMDRPEDAVRVATNALAMAKSQYDKQKAESALAGARQYQEFKAKMKQQGSPPQEQKPAKESPAN